MELVVWESWCGSHGESGAALKGGRSKKGKW